MAPFSLKRHAIATLTTAALNEIELGSDSSDSTGYGELAGPLNLSFEEEEHEDEELLNTSFETAVEEMEWEAAMNEEILTQVPPPIPDDRQPYGTLALGFCTMALLNILSSRYLLDRRHTRGNKTLMNQLLGDWKFNRPKRFRQWLRINPDAFDSLVDDISDFDGFHNNSYMKQTAVDIQLAVALHRFGSYGNRGGVGFIADLYGFSYGFVILATNRVILAAMSMRPVVQAVQWPSPEQREAAKDAVVEICGGNEDLRGGWTIQDGTLVQIFEKPHYCGSMFFDRKCRYSLNVQMTTLPTGEIVDYTCGHVGSTHDAVTMRSSRLYNDQISDGAKQLLDSQDFCWADSAYPLHEWLIKPFSEKELSEAGSKAQTKARIRFNKTLSRVRVRSEHLIGYLKGQFQSLQGLRIVISKENDMAFAMQWVRACIHLHMYAFHREKDPCQLSERFCRRGSRRERRLNRVWRKEEARHIWEIESTIGTRQSKNLSRRVQRINRELGKIRRDLLCASVKKHRKKNK